MLFYQVFFGVMMGSMNLGMTSPFIEAFGIACGAAGAVYSVIERQPSIDSMSDAGNKPDKIEGSISFKKVRFNYPSRADVPVLEGLNLDIRRGETVALVGSSGCGKSTCVQLIQRFYDPHEGKVRFFVKPFLYDIIFYKYYKSVPLCIIFFFNKN
jgi:ABC-type multidrug transport system fused ATPase/permease subunit